jgi:hypothetical protein
MTYNRSEKKEIILRETNVDKLSKNYEELDTEGKETLLRIGEKVFMVKNFVLMELSSLTTKKDLKFENGGSR